MLRYNPQIAIIGPGAMGSLLGKYLFDNGALEAKFFDRQGPIEHRFKVIAQGEQHYTFTAANLSEGISQVDTALLTVRAPDLEQALAHYVPRFKAKIPVIVLCNGIVDSVVSPYRAMYPELLWRRGVLSYAATAVGPKAWQLTHVTGSMVFGSISQKEPRAVASSVEVQLTKALPDCSWRENVSQAVQQKWLFNTALNSALGALNLKVNGDAMFNQPFLQELFDEAYLLGQELWGAWPEDKSALYQRLLQLIKNTAQNQNSLLRDLARGQRTESLFLAGLALSAKGHYPALIAAHHKIMQASHDAAKY